MFGDLVVNLVARVNQFTAPMAAARRALVGFGQIAGSSAAGVGQAMMGMGSGVANAAAGMASALTNVAGRALTSVAGQFAALSLASRAAGSVMSLATWGVSQAVQAEKAKIAFEAFLGNKDEALDLFNKLTTFGIRTGYGEKALETGKMLAAVGIPVKQILPDLKALGDIAQGDANMLHQLALALSQVKNAGNLKGQEVLQFVNAGFNPLMQIAKMRAAAQGIANPEDLMPGLKKEMEEAKISFKMVEDAIIAATSAGGQFDDLLNKMAGTVGQQATILQGGIGLVLRDVAASFMAGFGMGEALGGLNEIVDHLIDNSDQWMPIFIQFGADAREWVDSMIAVGPELVPIWESFRDSILACWDAFKLFLATMKQLGIGDLILGTLKGSMDQLATMLNLISKTVEMIQSIAFDMGIIDPKGGDVVPEKWKGDVEIEDADKVKRDEMRQLNQELQQDRRNELWMAGKPIPEIEKENRERNARIKAKRPPPLFFDENDPANAAWQFAQQTGKTAEDMALDKRRAKFEQKTAAEDARNILEIRKRKEREWAAMSPEEKLLELQNKPWRALGREDEIEDIAVKVGKKGTGEKFKLSGALQAGSKEAYSWIVNSMYRTGGQSPQEKALVIQREELKQAKKVADGINNLREDIKKQKIGIVAKLN